MVYTIGHSTHTLDNFISLLGLHSITAVADVRSSPYSRYNPQFNRETFQKALKHHGIFYVFLGNELGARPNDPACYLNGRVSFERMITTPSFSEGLKRIINGINTHIIALTCVEKDPLKCHRTILVSRQLSLSSIDIAHILENGELEPHTAAEIRLLKEEGLSAPELFRNREDIIAEAYKRRGEEIAFIENREDAQISRMAVI